MLARNIFNAFGKNSRTQSILLRCARRKKYTNLPGRDSASPWLFSRDTSSRANSIVPHSLLHGSKYTRQEWLATFDLVHCWSPANLPVAKRWWHVSASRPAVPYRNWCWPIHVETGALQSWERVKSEACYRQGIRILSSTAWWGSQRCSDYIMLQCCQVFAASLRPQRSSPWVPIRPNLTWTSAVCCLPSCAVPDDAASQITLAFTRCTETGFNELCRQLAPLMMWRVMRLAYCLLAYIKAANHIAGYAGQELHWQQ